MTDKRTPSMAEPGSMEGNEPMSGAQRASLKALCGLAKQPFDENLSKAEASRRIDELQAITGRGQKGSDQDEGRSTAAVETIVSR